MAQIHYEVIEVGSSKVLASGRTPTPPLVGECLTVQRVVYKVDERIWHPAGDMLSADALSKWGNAPGDHVFACLYVRRL